LKNIVHLHPVAHCYNTFTFLFRLCAACQCLKHFIVFSHLSLFKIFKITTCFGLNWPSSSVKICLIRKLLLFYSVMLIRPFVFRVCLFHVVSLPACDVEEAISRPAAKEISGIYGTRKLINTVSTEDRRHIESFLEKRLTFKISCCTYFSVFRLH
jgi:hypothetical protein